MGTLWFFLCVYALFSCSTAVVTREPSIWRSFKHLLARDSDSNTSYVISPVQQNFQVDPPVPIIDLSALYIEAATNTSNSSFPSRFVKDGPELCGPGDPCPDGSCCSNKGICGYGPTYCGSGNCTSQCDAKAMCGIYSDGGSVKCGMNICCSFHGWCGTSILHCGNPDPHGLSPCQENFGLCHTVPPPSCGAGGGSTNGRSIGYYQASNTRDRLCNRISPNQIIKTGLTHLYFAFAHFDPHTYEIVEDTEGDSELYTEFTKLKSSNLETWIALGGFDFSDTGPTHTAWSNMTSTQSNRAAFISSLQKFMSQYGFQGVDLDWEYPGAADRGGGGHVDTQNYVSLVKEMRAAFGTQFGISVTLAPDYWYLRWFDAKGMEQYVDHFGFMAYDLHGSWDADVKALGSIVRGQTDIREIYNDTLPLWFDGLNPSKINFGLAYYGRGYTLADPSCNTIGCKFTGPSKPAPCTNFKGVMSLLEIEATIKEHHISPQLLEDSMMKQITWDDQWIGYDDSQTIAMKKKWADGYCFGGTMVWSVDFNSGIGSGSTPGGGTPNVTTDGRCGTQFGGTVCGDWSTGACCSADGYCGNSSDHCAAGTCQSGPCATGGETTDGTCGSNYGNTICGSWSQGACCSSAGFCGASSDHCGDGCQSGPCSSGNNSSSGGSSGSGGSGSGSGDVYINPSIWTEPNPMVHCEPPCILILPPYTLSSATTISFPPWTTSLEVGFPIVKTTTVAGGSVETVTASYVRLIETTVLTIPPVTTSKIEFWNVNVTGSTSTSYPVTSSILPPPFTITDNPGTASSSGIIFPPQTRTITPPPWPYSTSNPPPPGGGPPPSWVTWVPGPPAPVCLIGCGSKCILFCDKPCLLDCINLPGINFPDPNDPEPLPNPNPDSDENQSHTSQTESKTCTRSSVVTDYVVSCVTGGASASCTTISTAYETGCEVTATTQTTLASCPTAEPYDDDQGQDGEGPPPSPNSGASETGGASASASASASKGGGSAAQSSGAATSPSPAGETSPSSAAATTTSPVASIPAPPSATSSFGLYMVSNNNPRCAESELDGCNSIKLNAIDTCDTAAMDSSSATLKESSVWATDPSVGELWWGNGVCGSPPPYAYFCYTGPPDNDMDATWIWQCNDNLGQNRAACENVTIGAGSYYCNAPSADYGFEFKPFAYCKSDLSCPDKVPALSQSDPPSRRRDAAPHLNDTGFDDWDKYDWQDPFHNLVGDDDIQTAKNRGDRLMCLFDQLKTLPMPSRFMDFSQLEQYGWRIKPGWDHDTPSDDIDTALEALGIGIGPPNRAVYWWHGAEWTDDQGTHEPTKGYFFNYFNTASGLIIASYNKSPQAEGGYIPPLTRWSDIVGLTWARLTGNNQSKLRYVLRHFVVTPSSVAVINWAIKRLVPAGGDMNPLWPGVEIPIDSEEGRALLGTVHGAGVSWLLINHSEAIGKRPTSVYLFWSDTVLQCLMFKLGPL